MAETSITAHALRRYSERCAGGPGLEVEVATLRNPTKRQWQAIKSRNCGRHHEAPRGKPWRQRIMVTSSGTVVVIAERDDGYRQIITCWPLSR